MKTIIKYKYSFILFINFLIHLPINEVYAQCLNTSVTTIAGSGTQGFLDADSTFAQFNSLTGITVNSSNEIFIADFSNHRIRRIDNQGQVTTFAGTGAPGFQDGAGNIARFHSPSDIIVDANDNLFVTEFSTHRIRMITSAGVVSTVAGNGNPGFVNANGIMAQFNNPTGIAVSHTGELFISDSGNHAIRQISTAGMVTAIAGTNTPGFVDAMGAAARFDTPRGVSIHPSGNIVVSDQNNNSIRSITPAGNVTTIAGTGAIGFMDGPGATATLSGPNGIIVAPDGIIYFTDSGNHSIRFIDLLGNVTTLAGTGNPGYLDGTNALAVFNAPKGIALDAAGNIIVADQSNHRVRKIGECLLMAAVNIPTISQWGIISLILIFLILGVGLIRKKVRVNETKQRLNY